MNLKFVSVVFVVLFFFCHAVISQKPMLKFSKDKKFKIVQFTDVHYVPGNIESETPVKTISTVLDAEMPDLVVFTGDIVTSPPVETGWKVITKLVSDRKIPYAIVLGNHDDESDLSREQIGKLLETLPYCLFVSKVENITGFGNYVLPVQASGDGSKPAALLYCLDSNAYNHHDTTGGYDWIQPDQIAWYKRQSEAYKKSNAGKVLPALAFFHIPLPEYRMAYVDETFPAIGLRMEDECSPKFNSGLFEVMKTEGDVMATFTGHDHNNDYAACKDGIALVYGRFTGGKTIYGELESGARIIQLTEGKRTFKTWIRTSSGKIFGSAVYPEVFIKNQAKK